MGSPLHRLRLPILKLTLFNSVRGAALCLQSLTACASYHALSARHADIVILSTSTCGRPSWGSARTKLFETGESRQTMLESLRRGAQSTLAKILFGLLVASFALWGIGDVFQGFGQGAIAKIGGRSISAEEFRRDFQSELERFSREANRRITTEQAHAVGLDRRVLQQILGSAAIEHHTESLGLGRSDAEMVKDVQNDQNFKGADGKFSRPQFEGFLRQIGMSEQGFLKLKRKEDLRTEVLGALVNSLTVPKPLFDVMHGYNEEKRVIEHVTINSGTAAPVAPPDEVKLKEAYDASKAQYMTPEYRKFEVLSLTLDDLKKQVEVTDDDIKKSYEATKESYNVPEQRRVQQVAFKDKAAADAAKKALDSDSKSFSDIAKDAGAKDSDIDLGLITRKQLIDPKVADAVFALAKDKTSDVIEGRFTNVIARVTQIEPGVTKTFDDVKDQVKDKIAAEKARGELQKKVDEVEDSRNAGRSLKDIADTMKISFREVAAADRNGMGLDGKPAFDSTDLIKISTQAFAPDVGSSDQIIELTGGGYGWVNLLTTEAPKQKAFDEVKEQVKDSYIKNERARLISELAKKLVEKLNNGEPMSAIEAETGGKVEKTEAITRLTVAQGLTESANAQAFALAKGKAGRALTSDKTSETIFRVADVQPAGAPTEAQTTNLNKTLSEELTNQVLAEYTDTLKARLGASVNDALFKSAVGVSDP